MKRNAIVFTDLDGSLLDHETYGYEPALPALERLQRNGVPIVPVTSKTLEEIELLQLPFDQPYRIGENGMVIESDSKVEVQGVSYDAITAFIEQLPESLRENIYGFDAMSVEDVIHHTGLNHSQATAAKARQATEPFLWTGEEQELEGLKLLAAQQQLFITQGGRFYHLMGKGNKQTALQKVLDAAYSSSDPVTIALGDGPNDAEMLGFAEYGVIIPNPSGASVSVAEAKGEIVQATHAGPAGWNAALHTILDELGLSV